MNIIELNPENIEKLQSFKDMEYIAVDSAHFGNNPPVWIKETFTLIAKEETEIAGFIRVKVDMGIAYIESLLVGEKFRRHGIGSDLVQSAEQKSKKIGAHKIWLETGADWGTEDFYKKLGYEVRAVLPNHVAHQECLLTDKIF